MNRIALALLALPALCASAFAQTVGPGQIPVPQAGAYNSAAPTCTAGQYCTVQTDINGNVKVNIAAGAGGGLSVTDQAGFTQGVSAFTPSGGVFNDAATLSSGQQGTNRLTTKRAVIVDTDVTGNALYSAITAPLPDCAATPCTNRAGIVNQGQSVPVTGTLQNAAVANANGTVLNTAGMSSAVLTVNCATCSGGTQVNFEVTEDGTNYSAINAVQLGTTTIASTTVASGIALWEAPVSGTVSLRARISGYSAGTVTITGHTVPVPYSPKIVAANQAGAPWAFNESQINGVTPLMGNGVTGTGSPRVTIASDNTAFSVNAVQSGTWTVQPGNTANTTPWLFKIDQTTPGTTNGVQLPTTTNGGAATVKGGVGVVNGASTYQAVAASQTATALTGGSGGAAGDYLSHCTIYPTSVSPGVVTVFDSTNTAANSAILFPGGTSSVSSLVPFPIPVGALSVNGAWKVTTGANVSVVCEGKFT